MLRRLLSTSPLAFALFTLSVTAQSIVDAISFGHSGSISPNGQTIPGFHLSGEGHEPQILSDRIILTPPVPGSTRGALWADSPVNMAEWSAELAFRASGQDRGSGNFQVWFVREGRTAVGLNSVYTATTFDGLVLTVDQYGGRGGTLRGFLNDGSTNFKDHHNVDTLAFGHCDFAYRNLGRPSRIRLTNNAAGFRVDIDDRLCFSSDKIKLPEGNHFGMTAATADNPDSFEVNHFVVTSSIASQSPPSHPSTPQQHTNKLPGAPEILPDQDASNLKRQEEQFADLHNRLQSISHQMTNLFGEFERISNTMQERHNEILGKIPRSADEAMSSLSRRIEGIERTVQIMQKDVEGRDYKEHLSNLQQAVEGVRGGLSDSLPDKLTQSTSSIFTVSETFTDMSAVVNTSAPRIGTFIFVVVAVQVMLLGAYIVYRKRRDSAPKKYL